MKIIPSLETERLRLRACTEDGVEAIFVLLQDEEVNRFYRCFFCKRWRKRGSICEKSV